MLKYEFTYPNDISDEDYAELIEQKYYNFCLRYRLWHDENMPIIRHAELIRIKYKYGGDYCFVRETWRMSENKAYLAKNRAKRVTWYKGLGNSE